MERYRQLEENGIFNEDCLKMDIRRPLRPSSDKLPIFVYIHGGGFVSGSSSIYFPNAMVNRGAIVILIQYRLHIMGFMNTFE